MNTINPSSTRPAWAFYKNSLPSCLVPHCGLPLILGAIFSAFLLLSPNAAGASINWASATDGNWTNGASWTGGVAPANDATTNGDTANFDDSGTYTVTLDTNRSVRNLQVLDNGSPTLDFTGYTLTVGNIVRSYNNSKLTLVGGTIAGVWYQAYNGGNNSLFTITGTNAHVAASGGGQVGYTDGNATNNSNTLLITNGASYISSSGTVSIGLVGVNATANAQATNNKIVVTGTGSELKNNGGIRIGSSSGGTNTGRLAVGNSLIIDDGASVSAWQVQLGYSQGGSGVSMKSNSLIVGGTGATATLNLTNSAWALGIGEHDGDNAAIINTGGIINATNGDTTVGSTNGSTGNTLRVVGGTLNSEGRSITVRDNAAMYLGSNGVVSVKTLTIATNASFGDKTNAAVAGFSSGTLNVQNLTSQSATVFSVGDNSGTNHATLNLAGANTNIHEFAAGITVEQSDGWLTGNGTIRGLGNTNTTLTVNGTISPGNSAGKISVKGDLVSGSNAVFNFEIASLASFDELYVSGGAGFDGTLNLALLGGYMPDVGNSFKLFDFTNSSGSFSTLNLAALDGGKSWDTSSLYSNGTISVIPEPSTLALFALGGLAALLRRRRN